MFHVPENRRIRRGLMGSDSGEGNNGAFLIPSIEPGWDLVFIASDGEDWEHVSVRAVRLGRNHSRIPSWREMVYVKALCWDADDVVMQLHPPQSAYVNCHPDVLHLWRPIGVAIPLPPPWLVGPPPATS